MKLNEVLPITKYGVTLRPLTHDKIEMLRQWRNNPKIQQYMEYREEITPDMQEQWYQKISNSGKDFYFIIEVDNKEIGCINIRDVDWEKLEGEPGIFIWDDDYLDSDAPTRASFAMGQFVWDELGLKREIIHVQRDNTRAINYNVSMGFRLSEGQENVYNQEYTLTRGTKTKRSELLKKYLEKTYH